MKSMRCPGWIALAVVALGLVAAGGIAQSTATSSDPLASKPGLTRGMQSITAQEFKEQLAWWAHDDRGGREPGTPGNIQAGNVAAAEFRRLGLEPAGDVVNGQRTYFQNFERGGKYGYDPKDGRLTVGAKPFVLEKDYTLAGRVNEADLKDLPVVFAGYGIKSRRFHYDDYEGIDAKDRAVLIFNHEPQQNDPKSRWYGTRRTPDSSTFRKIRNARTAGAKLLIMVDGPLHHESADNAPASRPTGTKSDLMRTGSLYTRDCPLLHVRREVADALLAGSGQTLEGLQKAIDDADKPSSHALSSRVSFQAKRTLIHPARNILALFPGHDPRVKDEVIVIGAHYDHLGVGDYGSRTPHRRGEIHNGADDNATGSVGVLELAEAFAESGVKTRRSILFMLFDAEEKGLYGSRHFVDHPTVPIEKIVAMINMDMIGYVKDNRMSVSGTSTAQVWDKILAPAEHGSPLTWSHRPGASGGSDHLCFVQKKIPVLMFNSGLHPYYHTPDDDAERCNPEGAQEVLRVLFRIAYQAANLSERPVWQEPRRAPASASPDRVSLGVSVKTDRKARGARVVDVLAGTPASQAGLRLDDVIQQIGKSKVTNRLGVRRALRAVKPGETVPVVVDRHGQEKTIQVTFPPRKARPQKGTVKKAEEKKRPTEKLPVK